MMTNNLDSLIALLIASAAIVVMIVALYRNGALSLRGVFVISTLLILITGALGSTL